MLPVMRYRGTPGDIYALFTLTTTIIRHYQTCVVLEVEFVFLSGLSEECSLQNLLGMSGYFANAVAVAGLVGLHDPSLGDLDLVDVLPLQISTSHNLVRSVTTLRSPTLARLGIWY